MQTDSRYIDPRITTLKVLVIDDEAYMRKVTKTILGAIGIKNLLEATDGATGLEMARTNRPGLIIVDWEMPLIDGAQFVQMVRTPGDFPIPEVPIIMLSAHADLWRVKESARIGANEFVRKPVSIKTLESRIVAAVTQPRPTVKLKGYYGPMPRARTSLGAFGRR